MLTSRVAMKLGQLKFGAFKFGTGQVATARRFAAWVLGLCVAWNTSVRELSRRAVLALRLSRMSHLVPVPAVVVRTR